MKFNFCQLKNCLAVYVNVIMLKKFFAKISLLKFLFKNLIIYLIILMGNTT